MLGNIKYIVFCNKKVKIRWRRGDRGYRTGTGKDQYLVCDLAENAVLLDLRWAETSCLIGYDL
jgi:hypothetical protein